MNKAYIALGTNIEPRESFLKQAIQLLHDKETIQIRKKSSIYQTAPVGYIEQEDFLNMVLEISTQLSAEKLLTRCQEIENELGRKREIRFGPRTIDLDILIYNKEIKETEQLTIPHPRMSERGFVLVPFNEIAPDVTLPGTGKTIKELLNHLPERDKEEIKIWKTVDLVEE